MTITLHHGDCVTWAREYSGEPFHALLCDPPYHLTSIVKRFGKNGSAPAKFGKDGAFSRTSGGFMGKQWDGGDLAFQPETWAAFASVLYPGAFGMAFASSRGWHRLAVAIEDAGLIIHPSIFGWAYGSGFPKATRIDKAPKQQGDVNTDSFFTGKKTRCSNCGKQFFSGSPCQCPKPKSEHPFAGRRYGLQALKPALEPIIVFQKPYEGRPVDNITATGAGSLWIDGARIPHGEDVDLEAKQRQQHDNNWGGIARSLMGKEIDMYKPGGRYPANFYLDAEAARRLDEQSGERHSYGPYRKSDGVGTGEGVTYMAQKPQGTVYSDSGGASRFFFRVNEQIDDADPVRYVAKASRAERDAGLDGMPIVIEQTLNDGWERQDPKAGTNRHGAINPRNPHPTVKPLALCKYLATLLLPPAEYAPRRLFVPFAGVASECIGAMQAGWEHVEGVEITEEYLPIARARVEYWQEKAAQSQMELPL